MGTTSKMAEENGQVLPTELLEIILKKLDVESLYSARRTCLLWKNIVDDITKKISCIIIVGGNNTSSVEVLTGDLGTKQLPNLPRRIESSSMVLHNETILLCGGYENGQKCLQLDHGTWKEHSTLNELRAYHSTVTTQTATFHFGGWHSESTYEFLPKDSTTWLMGKTEIPGGGFRCGCAIAVSDQEIWLIGGYETTKRILSFNVKDHSFQELPSQLIIGRADHRCAFIPNTNKIMITGGDCRDDNSAEILDTEDGSVTMASPMNSKRLYHGMGFVTVNGEERLAVFGGYDGRTEFDSVELYNTQTGKWENTD